MNKRKPLKLKARTTYFDNRGGHASIAGLARREPVDGKICWWSIQGDHYTEDGRFIHSTRQRPEGFTIDDDPRSLQSEDTSKEAIDWWRDVKT